MGKRRHGNWAENGTSSRNSGSSPEQDSREAMWEGYVRYEANKEQLTISMGGWAMTDRDVESWCRWFMSYLDRLSTGGRRSDELWANEVNFAENQLTSAGVRCLLETLTAGKVYVLVLKLHHNQLTSGASVAEFIHNSQGSLRELHLSHNELENAAAAEIVLAAAATCDLRGHFCYPSHAGHSAAPLWLRLEQNFIDPHVLSQRTDPQFEKIRPGKVLCNVSSRACTPHCCVKNRHDPPPVHAKHLSNQRSKPTTPNKTTTTAEDLLTVLKSGKKVSESRGKPGDKSAAKPIEATEDDAEKRAGPDKPSESGVFADVLRWDEDELRWVRDVIQIPERPPEAADDTGRIKLSQEVGDKLGNELKSMIVGSKRPDDKKTQASASSASPTYTKPKSDDFQSLRIFQGEAIDIDSAGQVARCISGVDSNVQDEEPSNRSPASRRSRRGGQPLGSEVKQVNGLNPQAKEFFPITGAPAPQKKVHELNLQAFLNPEAEEFTPSDSQPSTIRSSSQPAADTDEVAPAVDTTEQDGVACIAEEKASCADDTDWSIGKAFYSFFGMGSAAKDEAQRNK